MWGQLRLPASCSPDHQPAAVRPGQHTSIPRVPQCSTYQNSRVLNRVILQRLPTVRQRSCKISPKSNVRPCCCFSCVLRTLLLLKPAAGPMKAPRRRLPVCSTLHHLPPQPHSASAKRMKDKTPQRKTPAALSCTPMRAGARWRRQQPPQMSRWDTHTTGRGKGVHPYCCRLQHAWAQRAPVPGAPASA